MNTNEQQPIKPDEQQSPAGQDTIRKNDRETEENVGKENREQAEKSTLNGPANDLIGQPAPKRDE